MSTSDIHKQRKSRTNWFVMIFNVLAALALVFSYLATHIRPSTFEYLSLFGLGYPFILLVNFLFVFYWFFKKRKLMLLSLFAFFIGWNHFTDFFQLSFPSKKKEDQKELKVLTYNVRLLGYYDEKKSIEKRDKIFDLLDKEQADVLCFQEFYHTDREGVFETRDTIVKFLPNKFYHERFTHALSKKQYFGVALFSRYPIIKKGHVPFASDANNFCIYVDLKIKDDTVRVYNAHLQSIRFRPEDYALVDGNKNQEQIEKGGKRIARRLTSAFVKREEQVERIIESIQSCPHKVVLCGDFNDTPVSYAYEAFTDELKDSFIEAGSGIGNTYIGVFPSFRIDYILHSKGMEAIKYRTLPEKYSDHHAITATLVW